MKPHIKSIIEKLIEGYHLPSKSCSCGCNTCESVGNKGPILNENLISPKPISNNLQYHIDSKKPLTENTFRYGSQAFLDLWREARHLYVREVIHLLNHNTTQNSPVKLIFY